MNDDNKIIDSEEINNPLLQSYDTAPFSKIKNQHFLPAIIKLIEDSKAEIDEPGNLDLAELAKKSRYKNAETAKRLKALDIQLSDSSAKDGKCSEK